MVTSLAPKNLVPIARKTVQNVWNCSSRVIKNPFADGLFWVDDLSMGWLGAAHAWMGNGEKAFEMISDGWLKNCLLPNLFLSSVTARPDERPENMWMQNQLSGLANVVNEMLLQSHGGVIQIFPAVPAKWKDILFVNMRARGAFTVSASMEKGKVKWGSITASAGRNIVLKNPFASNDVRKIKIKDTDSGEFVKYACNRGSMKFTMKKGQNIILRDSWPPME